MMERLSESLWRLRHRLLHRRIKNPRGTPPPAPIKGNMRNVIVIKPKNGIFSEAMFVLSDEYVRNQSLSSQELLRQAIEAAGEYSASLTPTMRRGAWKFWLALGLLGLGIFVLARLLMGI